MTFATASKYRRLNIQTSNPNQLSITTSDVDQAKRMLTQPDCLKSERTAVTERDGTLNVALLGDKTKIGYPLHLKMTLSEGCKEMFFELVTRPLLDAIHQLRASETDLIRLLMKKDDEIAEYKCEGGEIALRHLKTVPFSAEAHRRQYACSTDHIPDSEYLHSLKPRAIADTVPKIEIKSEMTSSNLGTDISVKLESESGDRTSNTDSRCDVTTSNTASRSDIRTETGSHCADPDRKPLRNHPEPDVKIKSEPSSQTEPNLRKKRRIKLNI